MMLEMAQLMAQHRQQFVVVQFVQQRIEKHDPLGFAKAPEVGVEAIVPFAGVDDVDPFALEAASLQQIVDFGLEVFVLKGREFVEYRGDERGIEQIDQHDHGKKKYEAN